MGTVKSIPSCIIWKFQTHSVNYSIYDFDWVFLEIPVKKYMPYRDSKRGPYIGVGNNDYRFGLECLPSKKVQEFLVPFWWHTISARTSLLCHCFSLEKLFPKSFTRILCNTIVVDWTVCQPQYQRLSLLLYQNQQFLEQIILSIPNLETFQ